jgi:hypothetical protein
VEGFQPFGQRLELELLPLWLLSLSILQALFRTF